MTKSLKTLIRLARWEVDEKRRVLVALQAREEQIIAAIQGAKDQLVMEQQVASADGEAGFLYGAYANAWIRRRAEMESSLAQVREQVEVARDDLAEAFRQHKTYEITQANRDRRAREEADRKEQAVLDDIGIEIHRRKEKDVG
jgi:flagellar export protein FliJ